MANAETTGAAAPSGAATYDSVAQAVHWLVTALAVIVVPLGWAIAGAPRATLPSAISSCCTAPPG
jgi:hypothetical protein